MTIPLPARLSASLTLAVTLLILAAATGCHPVPPPPPPASAGQPLRGDGPRCTSTSGGSTCRCRALDESGNSLTAEEAGITPGYKRFEVRTGRSLDAQSVDIEGHGTLVKEAGTPEPACAYVDLAPGHYRLRLHAKSNTDVGMVPSLFVYEYGSRTHDWYWTYQFRCGNNDVCSQGDLDTLAEEPHHGAAPDPCGSTKVEGVRWQGHHGAAHQILELDVDVGLHVYKFSPRFPHAPANGKCSGTGGVDDNEGPLPE